LPSLQIPEAVKDLRRDQIQSNPIQSNPIQSNPIQSNPIQSNPIQSNPIQLSNQPAQENFILMIEPYYENKAINTVGTIDSWSSSSSSSSFSYSFGDLCVLTEIN
jgi:hypothetical protein